MKVYLALPEVKYKDDIAPAIYMNFCYQRRRRFTYAYSFGELHRFGKLPLAKETRVTGY